MVKYNRWWLLHHRKSHGTTNPIIGYPNNLCDILITVKQEYEITKTQAYWCLNNTLYTMAGKAACVHVYDLWQCMLLCYRAPHNIEMLCLDVSSALVVSSYTPVYRNGQCNEQGINNKSFHRPSRSCYKGSYPCNFIWHQLLRSHPNTYSDQMQHDGVFTSSNTIRIYNHATEQIDTERHAFWGTRRGF